MKNGSSGFGFLMAGILVFVLLCVVGVPLLFDWKERRDQNILSEEAVRPLRGSDLNGQGYWVGDIAELYRLGKISRELAEADTAPMNPLVPSPMPFHGYFVRVLDSGPPQTTTSDAPVPLKGVKRTRETFAYCLYPAHPTSMRPTWILCNLAIFRSVDGWSPQGWAWPTRTEFGMHWGIVD